MLEAKADGEVFWAHIAYTTFEAGALPSLLRLRRPAAKERPSLRVGDIVQLECACFRGSAQWCSLFDFVELCDPSVCWTVRFWIGHNVADNNPEESEAEPWWRGDADAANCAHAAEIPPSDGELEEDRREASERQEERSQEECSQGSDDLGEQSEEEPQIAAMAAAANARKRRGQWFDCRASKRAGRYALRFHLVFKDGDPKKRSQFQITCDHHEPDVLVNKAG